MPTAMHPWMDPTLETRLWPHEYSPVYEQLNRIFDGRGHGWSNVQSVHLNLPFADDAEFARLHAAVRVLLPILPALSASSPLAEGRLTGYSDFRMEAYRTNCRRVPMVTGAVIPEPVFTRDEYERDILTPMYAAIAPHDPEGLLQHEWLNARGAIARFDRNTIEIRVLDVQECPEADLAIAGAVVQVLRGLVEERWSSQAAQRAWAVGPLADMLNRVIRDGERAEIHESAYLSMMGCPGPSTMTAGELWRHLLANVASCQISALGEHARTLEVILGEGTLSSRIVRALGGRCDRATLAGVYRDLVDCLAEGRIFHA